MTRLLSILFLALTASAGTVSLMWDANDASDGVAKYRIYTRNAIVTNWTQIGYVVSPTNTFTATNVPSGVNWFRGTAVSTNEVEGSPSNEVSTNLFLTPGAMRNMRITAATSTNLTFSVEITTP